jgi:hypothetical protein
MKNFEPTMETQKAFEMLQSNEDFQQVYFNEHSKEERISAGKNEFWMMNEEWVDILVQDGEKYVCYHSYSDNTLQNAWDCDFCLKIK